MDWIGTMTAVLAANFLILMFGYGVWRTRNTRRDDPLGLPDFLALVVPLFVLAAGAYLYG